MPVDLASAIRAIVSRQDGLLTAQQARSVGLTKYDVDNAVRAGRWLALLRGIYLIDAEPYDDRVPQRTWWRAALLAHGPGFCLVGGTGARLFGLHGMPVIETSVEVAGSQITPRHPRPTVLPQLAAGPEIVVRQVMIDPSEIEIVDGLPVRRGDLTVIDAALPLDRKRMLALLDSALHREVATIEEIELAYERAKGRRGIARLRPLIPLADGRAESMLESFVRLDCIDGDVPPDDLQYPVRSEDGHLIALGDLGWYKRRRRPLLGEADGRSVHELPEAVFRDRTRGNALAAYACDTVRFTYADTFRRGYVAAVVRNALAAG